MKDCIYKATTVYVYGIDVDNIDYRLINLTISYTNLNGWSVFKLLNRSLSGPIALTKSHNCDISLRALNLKEIETLFEEAGCTLVYPNIVKKKEVMSDEFIPVTVKILSLGSNKLQTVKFIKGFTSLGLKNSKELCDTIDEKPLILTKARDCVSSIINLNITETIAKLEEMGCEVAGVTKCKPDGDDKVDVEPFTIEPLLTSFKVKNTVIGISHKSKELTVTSNIIGKSTTVELNKLEEVLTELEAIKQGIIHCKTLLNK